ncbi:unnamed protein product [Closterium sp. NIES-64]|nr:unnamed protein product [Closterium sp. NIES-64]CAI5940190.1 unnamed protein product [Closterium sp. NIES-64]CAI5955487.1 unnamed protein product [Closterium sp. NIES-65]CAI6011879.1 unnamed protein product [Closterium sp. NIES-65]
MAGASSHHCHSHASWYAVLCLLLLSLSPTAWAQVGTVSPTKAEYLAELNTLASRLKKQSCSVMAKAVSSFASEVEKLTEASFSAGYKELTFLAPSDFAFTKATFRPRVSAVSPSEIVKYHTLSGLYSFAQLKALPNRSKIPTEAGKSIVKHSVRASKFWNPGTSVAVSSPGAQQLFWAQVDTKKLFNGKYVKGHVIDCVLVPN